MSTAPVPTHVPRASVAGGPVERLPVFSLVVLATMGFILVAMETMPAGLLPVIADGLDTSEGAVGLLISAYALGTVVATVPAITLTRGMRRKPLLLIAITGLVVANTVTALSPVIALALVSRFVAGAFSGVIWGMLAAYGRRISPPDRAGLSLAIVSAGAPVGFAFGTPLGSWLGTAFDWRWSFGGLSLLGVVVFVLVATIVPDAAPAPAGARLSLGRVFRIPGIAVILAVIAAWMLAHNTIYTYVSPYLRAGGSGLGVDVTLLIYGIASIGGIVVTGALLDRHPRALLHGSVAVFVVAGVVLLVGHASVPAVVVAAVLWGVTFGGASAQLQAALTTVGGDNADVANAFLPVAFNVAIFFAGIVGAALLTVADGLVLPLVMIGFGVVAFALTVYGRRNAFPAGL
ncbi:MFS transporter [Frigoribacterium sp. CFBP 8759]|uniref:MFS transporter n=1 Tax=Frigoribacterium sp. CFBP 8759 TaxID=2775283 RepID=UPI0017822E4D|nr:MFS transporter [Frigoribacterium sp. CFBP 8759]MBD8485014.1 MFS transporter [Frigoribacterium sp. CFBP 8759]